MENIRQIVPLDIATGDVITPHPIDYKYVSSFGEEDIIIKAYPIETMLAFFIPAGQITSSSSFENLAKRFIER